MTSKLNLAWKSHTTRVIDVINLFFDMLSVGVLTTRFFQTSGRLLQDLMSVLYRPLSAIKLCILGRPVG